MDSENFKIIGVAKDIVCIEIIDPTEFNGQFNIGSYIKIPYKHDSGNFIIGIIKNYKITNNLQMQDKNNFIIEVELIGSYRKNKNDKYIFERGAHGIPLPPNNGIKILTYDDYECIYSCKISGSEKFIFSKLAQDEKISVPVNGNKFFNKHFAIVGSTGSGKSHTVATVLQQAVKEKRDDSFELNNSHIVIFDIHGEYKKAFPDANHINSNNIQIPYWLLNSEELEELFLESGDFNNYNQSSLLRFIITTNKEKYNPAGKIFFDSPVKFDLEEVLICLQNLAKETKSYKNSSQIAFTGGHSYQVFGKESEKFLYYFLNAYEFEEPKNQNFSKGNYADGSIDKFISRLQAKISDKRLDFLLGNKSKDISFEDTIKQFIGYRDGQNSNVTVIDLSGIPFEVLSITVSLISRILFEYGYYYKKLLDGDADCETPLLLVYEEAHKYVPRSDLVKYRASKNAIERIAKEGRKYGVTLGIVSQRPSEISETIFSQCNNFVVMRLTNPDDQNYVKKLLPDNLGDLVGYLPTLQSGEALIIGESIILPSLVKIDFPEKEPKSTDICYLDIWKEKWRKDIEFNKIIDEWKK